MVVFFITVSIFFIIISITRQNQFIYFKSENPHELSVITAKYAYRCLHFRFRKSYGTVIYNLYLKENSIKICRSRIFQFVTDIYGNKRIMDYGCKKTNTFCGENMIYMTIYRKLAIHPPIW